MYDLMSGTSDLVDLADSYVTACENLEEYANLNFDSPEQQAIKKLEAQCLEIIRSNVQKFSGVTNPILLDFVRDLLQALLCPASLYKKLWEYYFQFTPIGVDLEKVEAWEDAFAEMDRLSVTLRDLRWRLRRGCVKLDDDSCLRPVLQLD